MNEKQWFVCKMWNGEWHTGGTRKDYEGIDLLYSGYVMAIDRDDARKKGQAELRKINRRKNK